MATNYNKDHHNATPLYNGNISALTTDYLSTEINPLVKFFRYDKLNRIKGMKTNSDAGNPQCQPFYTYSTYYTYDHNGNLDTLIRYDSETNELHYIEYEYLSGNNRLDSITAWWGLNTGGYRYDAIGNLTRDNGEGLDISWNAAGKVDTIWKNGNVLSTFRYSATGQRQMKKTRNITDYYIHDASGNVMCIYRVSKHDFKAVERPIYGAKRLGELKQQVDLTTPTNPSIPPFTIGMRQYELTDHLGNVMATILDRRQLYSSGNDTYKPYIVSTTDYYPFGYPIPNRSTNTGGYRYFFNGQEGDNEVFGEIALQAFEFRMHDARLGRFWSVDPLAAKYPWNSTYAFAENRVIEGRELEGLEVVFSTREVVSAGGFGIYGWNYAKGHGHASDQIGITYYKYKSKAEISNNESVAGILFAGYRSVLGVDPISRTFEESINKGSISSVDVNPIFGGSIDKRENDWYFGGSISLGIGVAHTTTENEIKSSYSITYDELEQLQGIVYNNCRECKISINTLSTYTINGETYLSYEQKGNFFNMYKSVEIKTDIRMKNIGTKDEPQWQSEAYQQSLLPK
jgi:RHS repeat-associated protein